MEENKKFLGWFVTLGEIVFAVVLGTSLIEFNELLFPPIWSSLSFWALIVVYITVFTSWDGWHKSTSEYPYTDTRLGILRALADAVIIILYAALLYFGSRAEESLMWYLWTFFLVFLLYLISGSLRQRETHDPRASQPPWIRICGAVMLGLAIIYTILSSQVSQLSVVRILFMVFPGIIVLFYRYFREWRGLAWSAPHVLAIDVDGVLVEQVIPVLQKLERERNIKLNKSDITNWEYPFDKTNIKIEIEKAEREAEFVQKMQPIEGAVEATKALSESGRFDIVIATSRESCTDGWTREWFRNHGISYNKFINTSSRGKILSGVDVLIDDYIKNIEDFIRRGPPGRRAILFAQPWNQDISLISDLLASGKVTIAHSWQTVLALFGLLEAEPAKQVIQTEQPLNPNLGIMRDYLGLQALSCFLASFLFLRGHALFQEGASTFLQKVHWLYIPSAIGFLVLSFFFIAVVFSPQRLQNASKYILKVFGFSISIASVAGIMVAWVDGIKGVTAQSIWFKVFFWGGYAFILIYAIYFIVSSWRYARILKTKS